MTKSEKGSVELFVTPLLLSGEGRGRETASRCWLFSRTGGVGPVIESEERLKVRMTKKKMPRKEVANKRTRPIALSRAHASL